MSDRGEVLLPAHDVPSDRFFAHRGRPGDGVPAAELFGPGLDAALAAVQELRGTDRDPVAGVLLVEQYAQRLVGPVVAAAIEAGLAVDARPEAVTVRMVEGRIGPLAFASVAPAGERDPLEFVPSAFGPVIEAVHARTRVGRRVLHGSVAHAVAVAFLHLSWPRPEPAALLTEARRVLAAGGLEDLVRLEAVEVAGRAWLYADRRSCCLAFRTEHHRAQDPDQPYCATCPIVPEAERRASFAEAARTFHARRAASSP